VTSGLAAGERLIVEGRNKVMVGQIVHAVPVDTTVAEAANPGNATR
jgi:hypothetical protein